MPKASFDIAAERICTQRLGAAAAEAELGILGQFRCPIVAQTYTRTLAERGRISRRIGKIAERVRARRTNAVRGIEVEFAVDRLCHPHIYDIRVGGDPGLEEKILHRAGKIWRRNKRQELRRRRVEGQSTGLQVAAIPKNGGRTGKCCEGLKSCRPAIPQKLPARSSVVGTVERLLTAPSLVVCA